MSIFKTIKKEYIVRSFLQANYMTYFDCFDHAIKTSQVYLKRSNNLDGKYITKVLYRDIKFAISIITPTQNKKYYIIKYKVL